jgi:hypothetical protein
LLIEPEPDPLQTHRIEHVIDADIAFGLRETR